MRKLIPILLVVFVFSYSNTLYSQTCFTDNFAGSDTSLPCGVTCITLKVKVPDIRTTEDYGVRSIAYNPYPYVTGAAALTHPCTGGATSAQDDKYFDITNLPFNFCFYSSTYNKLIIGSNGAISFNTAEALLGSTYSMTNAIPFGGTGSLGSGACPSPSGTNYPRPGIFGLYHDIWPVVGDPYKIEARMEGRVPCRRFVISYDQIKLFNCSSVTATFQIVIYENTNIIEVYVQDKPVCSATNARAIIGIQNGDLSKFSSPPGRNLFQNDVHNEAWEFKPIGANSLLSSVELRQGGTVIATGVIGTSANGMIDVSFPNICPSSLPSNYTVRAYYQPCDDNITPYFIEDDIAITTGNSLGATAATTPANCASPTGSITITVPPGVGVAPLQYSLNGGPLQLSNVFSGLAANTYTILVQDAAGCQQTLTVPVPSITGITGTFTTTATSCPGVNNGSITITTTSGVGPYLYSLNGGPNQAANTFPNLAPGTYNITFTDVNGCIGTLQPTVASGIALQSNANSTNPPCAGINNGGISITPTSGTAPYQYSINGGPLQAGNTFNGLAPGSYTIDFIDAIGCTGSQTVILTGSSSISGASIPTMPLCNGGNDGVINISAAGGVAPYEYSINAGINYQPSSTFTNITAGSYTIRIRDFNGCTFDLPVTITEPTLLTASAVSTPSTCNATDGTITLTAGGGTPGYSFSIDNGTSYQASNVFNVAPGTYNNILIKDINGCTKPASVTVTLVDNMFLNAGADTTVCVGSGVTLQPQTNPETNIFNWSPATGLSSTSIKNPVASPTDTATYYLDFTWGACNRKDTIRVNVLHKPIAYAGKDTAICYKTIALFNGVASNLSGPVTYAWAPAGMVLNPTASSTTARPDSSQLFILTVKDNYGCNFTVTDDIFVTMQPPVPAYAGNDTNAVYGVPHQLFSSGGVSYLWSPASPLNNPFAQNPMATLTNDTYFNVQVTDVAGCIGNDGVFIKVYKGPTYYLPNAFSPNGDGLNEKFRPIPVGIKSTEYFRIYNRYGQLLFETNKWLDGWDGKYQGKPQQTGAYVWLIKGMDKDGKAVEMKGQVILVR